MFCTHGRPLSEQDGCAMQSMAAIFCILFWGQIWPSHTGPKAALYMQLSCPWLTVYILLPSHVWPCPNLLPDHQVTRFKSALRDRLWGVRANGDLLGPHTRPRLRPQRSQELYFVAGGRFSGYNCQTEQTWRRRHLAHGMIEVLLHRCLHWEEISGQNYNRLICGWPNCLHYNHRLLCFD